MGRRPVRSWVLSLRRACGWLCVTEQPWRFHVEHRRLEPPPSTNAKPCALPSRCSASAPRTAVLDSTEPTRPDGSPLDRQPHAGWRCESAHGDRTQPTSELGVALTRSWLPPAATLVEADDDIVSRCQLCLAQKGLVLNPGRFGLIAAVHPTRSSRSGTHLRAVDVNAWTWQEARARAV